MGKNITARLTPTLTFVADEVPENAFHIESLLRETRERDAKLAAAAEGAQYAGDADPQQEGRGRSGRGRLSGQEAAPGPLGPDGYR